MVCNVAMPLGRVVRVVERFAVQRHPVDGAALLTQQAVNGLKRALTLVGREGIRPAIEHERPLDVLLDLEQLPGTHRQPRRDGLVGLDLRELARVDLCETAASVRNTRETLELRPRGLIGDVLGEELGDRLERRLVVLLLLLVELREPPQQRPARVGVLAGRAGEPGARASPCATRRAPEIHRLQRLRGTRRVIVLLHQPFERDDRRLVLRLERERRLVLLERAIDVL